MKIHTFIACLGFSMIFQLLIPATAFAAEADVLERAEKCPIPDVPDNASIVFLSISRGNALSSATFQNQWATTALADIEIEAGSGDIYLIVLSYDMVIMRFVGAVERLTHVMGVGVQPTGYVNVDQSRISWFEMEECMVRGWIPGSMLSVPKKWWQPEKQREYVKTLAGGRFDSEVTQRFVSLIAIPSGENLERESVEGQVPPDLTGDKAEGWRIILQHYPDGIVTISLPDVVAREGLFEYRSLQLE